MVAFFFDQFNLSHPMLSGGRAAPHLMGSGPRRRWISDGRVERSPCLSWIGLILLGGAKLQDLFIGFDEFQRNANLSERLLTVSTGGILAQAPFDSGIFTANQCAFRSNSPLLSKMRPSLLSSHGSVCVQQVIAMLRSRGWPILIITPIDEDIPCIFLRLFQRV